MELKNQIFKLSNPDIIPIYWRGAIVMGYHTELNTLLGLPPDFDPASLKISQRYTITRDRERVFPLHIAILMVTYDWQFLGYAVAHSATTHNLQTTIEFEVLSLFNDSEKAIYRAKFLEVAKMTGEVK